MGGVNNISCHHVLVLVTNLLHRHWEWPEERSPMLKGGSVVRSTMFMASLDIKTAFAEARLRHLSKIMESHDIHGWLIAALLRECQDLRESDVSNASKALSLSIDVCAKEA